MRVATLALTLLLVACAPAHPEPEAQAPAAATLPAPTAPVAAPVQALDEAVTAAVEAIPAPPPPPVQVPADEPPLVDPRAVDLIIRWEVGSPDLYTRKYQRPVCPACTSTASGPTIGIGYDLGHATAAAIDLDWAAHPQRPDLHLGLGVTGREAIAITASMQHVVTPYPLAREVFGNASLVKYWRLCRRAFGPEAWDAAPPQVQGALVSVCYNRGGSMTGGARAEMREIRDIHLPARNWPGVADAIRRMERLWRGTPAYNGLKARRDDEANLVESP